MGKITKQIQQTFLALLLGGIALSGHADVVSHDVELSNTQWLTANSITTRTSNTPSLRVQLVAMGRDLSLLLEPSRFDRLAQQHSTDQNLPQLLQGSVEGHPNSCLLYTSPSPRD